jgi:hypothetical protein
MFKSFKSCPHYVLSIIFFFQISSFLRLFLLNFILIFFKVSTFLVFCFVFLFLRFPSIKLVLDCLIIWIDPGLVFSSFVLFFISFYYCFFILFELLNLELEFFFILSYFFTLIFFFQPPAKSIKSSYF